MVHRHLEDASIGCTVIQAGPCFVTQIKTEEKDGYSAIQLAYEDKKDKNVNKSLRGHFAKANISSKRKLAEFRFLNGFSGEKTLSLGDKVSILDVFKEGDYLDVRGTSKGKGFQGVVKRHGFKGVGSRTHGQHNRERAPGSIGASSFPSRVFKGMRMAGRSGGKKVFVGNLRVIDIIPEKDLIVVTGSVPGNKNSYVMLYR